jgi:hypothetical protein
MLVSFGICLTFTMQLQLPFSPLILSVIFLGAYIFCMWWLLRRERWSTLCALLLLTIGTAWLHTYQVLELPPGLNDDEIKTLKSTHEFFGNRKIFVLAAQGPILHAILFQMPLVWWTDSTWWAMRTYPIVFGILAVPISYSVGRALRFGITPSFVVAALVAILPWSLFWGRISWGGEIIFYQALLLAALGRIIWCDGGRNEVVIGALGLSGLLWDYTGAWSMLAMPFIAALVGHTLRQRVLCLGVFALAITLWIPYLLNIGEWWQHISNKVSVGAGAPTPSSVEGLQQRFDHVMMTLRQTLRAFYYPEGNVYWISMHSVAIHPIFVLAVAALGVVVSLVRRSLFVVLGFMAGLTPALLSYSGAPSTHRMMCAFIFVSIACGALFQSVAQALKGKAGSLANAAIALVFIGATGYQSFTLFFSEDFWKESNRIFFTSETALAETIRLPASPPVAAGLHVNRLLDAREVRLSGSTNMCFEHLAPTEPMTLAITTPLYPIVPFYLDNLPPEQVTSFGKGPYGTSVKAVFNESEVARWQKFGWTAERRCANNTLTNIHLPMFYLPHELGWRDLCYNQREVKMKAEWLREPTELSLVTSGGARVRLETSSGTALPPSTESRTERKVTLHPGEVVTITAESVHGSSTWLVEGSGPGAKIPKLESFRPVAP